MSQKIYKVSEDFAALAHLRLADYQRLYQESVRDPNGFRPLVIGRVDRTSGERGRPGDALVLSSETCAFDLIEAEFIREVDPGEIVVIENGGITSQRLPAPPELARSTHR